MKKYIAEVLDNNDPDQTGKVQIYIESLMWGFTDTSNSCPWAKQDRELTSDIPETGDMIWVYFFDEDHYRKPFYGNKLNLEDYHTHNESIGSIETEYPDVKYIKLKNGVAVALSSNDDTPEISIYHPNDTEIYIDSDGYLYYTDANGNTITLDNNGITIEDANGNDITMGTSSGTSSVTINGNFEVLQ